MKIFQAGTGTGSVTLYDFEPTPDRICEDVVRGLRRRPRTLPPKYFYDERGARLFERITGLAAYYPTRTEMGILRDHASEMAARVGPGVRLVEFGSGSGDKTWLLLRHLEQPTGYIPVDISRAQLVEFAIRVAEAFPALQVDAVCADYTSAYSLPDDRHGATRSVAFFPGSTLGNFEADEAERFLGRVRRLVGEDGGLLLGVDLRKDVGVMERAYNDPEGVTADFNLNLLRRINRECGADFELSGFRHHAFFDPERSRIEMRLVSQRSQKVTIGNGRDPDTSLIAEFDPDDYIITEYSHKYEAERFEAMATAAGWRTTARWTDAQEWFAVLLLE